MILIDSRIGSRHLAELIPNSILTQLESADVCFEANGITVGIELKKLMDAVGCMFNGRLVDHQIPLMKAQYDVVYLVIEGIYRPCPQSGILQYLKLFQNESKDNVQCGKWVDASHGKQRLLYSSFVSWVNTLAVQGGMLVKTTSSMEVTAALVIALYNWWQKSDHRSFRQMDETTESAVLSRPSMLRRMVALLPRVGWSRSAILAQRFTTVAGIVAAPPEAFLIEGEIALPTALKIWEALHGQERISSNSEDH
jgi:ERCC4-type nuclease